MNTAIINERQSKHASEWKLRIFMDRNKEVYVKLTDELMIFLDLKNYDSINFIDNDDGTWTIEKIILDNDDD